MCFQTPHQILTRYPKGADALSIAKLQSAPKASPAENLEWFRQVEIDMYSDVDVTHDVPMTEASQRRVRLAYYAGITHVDDQVGRLMAGLRDLGPGVDESTALVLTADHAQNLGEGASPIARYLCPPFLSLACFSE